MGTSTSTALDEQPATKHRFAHNTQLPPPYQYAIEDAAFQMKILDDRGARDYDRDCALLPAMWFSATLTAPTRKRFLYLVQHETATGLVVVITDATSGRGLSGSQTLVADGAPKEMPRLRLL